MLTSILFIAVCVCGLCLMMAFITYQLYNRRATPSKAPGPQLEGNANSGNQWQGKKLIYNAQSTPCERELLLFATCKDLQNTVNELFTQLGTKQLQIDRYHEKYLKQEALIEKQEQEIDGLRNELNEMKYAQVVNRFPVLEMKG
jgi:peptidoglycan hydrolase CwlO-like protein